VPEASFQRLFHARRGHLRNPYVRDLAWLLDSPDLLDRRQWQGRIATLFSQEGEAIDAWLGRLDDDPAELQALIERHGFNRLGRYAELLMAHFLRHIGALEAHGVQVRAASGETVGEFDFLLRDPSARLLHWEFATKYYLLEAGAGAASARTDDLVGPNLADTLGAKMRKILERQLNLSQHPAAQAALKETPQAAQALVKGWLFYAPGEEPLSDKLGLNPAHCRGFWRPLSELNEMGHDSFLILPRLRWLAPAQSDPGDCLDHYALAQALKAHFTVDSLPVMVTLMETDENGAFEIERGFIVPDDWSRRAAQFVRRAC
jgi:hypothetical protein